MKNLTIIIVIFIFLTSCTKKQKPVIEWVDIPAGTFLMGSPLDEVNRNENQTETQHLVTLSAFKMSKYEITFTQFKAFIDATGYETDAETGGNFITGSDSWKDESWGIVNANNINWRCDTRGNLRSAKEYNHPVIHVSCNDAIAFANWMDCRLPTEAEWEYACRAGTTTPFNTGQNLTTSQSNYRGDKPYNNNAKGEFRKNTMPVGSFPPNKWGLYDMHGNVEELCSDWPGDYDSIAQINPKGSSPTESSSPMCVSRGGSWSFDADDCRSARRHYRSKYERSYHCGFRLVTSK